MTASYGIKRHDLAPYIAFIVVGEDGFPLDLTPFTDVKFLMKRRGEMTILKVDRAASFIDKEKGVIRYEWQTGDTDTAGTFFAEFELTGPGGLKRTAPSRGLIRIDIAGDLDDA